MKVGLPAGGIVSSKFKGPAIYKKGSSKVKNEGNALGHLSSTTAHNGRSNANVPPGVDVAPSQSEAIVVA
jgi:hypothetical protein